MSPIRIAVCGSGRIVPETLSALEEVGGYTLTGILCRPCSEPRARGLMERFGIPRLWTEFHAFLREAEADFLYIAQVNNLHHPFAAAALEAGFNLLLEKPLCLSAGDAGDLLRRTEGSGGRRYVFETHSTLFNPLAGMLPSLVERLGGIRSMRVAFQQYSSRMDRYMRGEVAPAFDPAMGGGAMWDLGPYVLCPALRLLGKPRSLRYRARDGHNGVDLGGVLELSYPPARDGEPAPVVELVVAKDTEGSGDNGMRIVCRDGTISCPAKPNDLRPFTVEPADGGDPWTIRDDRYRSRLGWIYATAADMFHRGLWEDHLELLRYAVMETGVMEEALRTKTGSE